MLVIGGHDGTTHLTTTEILDIDTMKFSPGPLMSSGCSGCAVVSLHGSILVVGGGGGDSRTNTTEVLSFQAISFAAVPTILTACRGCAALVLPRDLSPSCVLVVGGCLQNSILSRTEVLTTVQRKCADTAGRIGAVGALPPPCGCDRPGPPNAPAKFK